MGYNNISATIGPKMISDAIIDRARTIANTGNFDQAVGAMNEAFKKSSALAAWFDCPDSTNETICRRQATQAVFFFRERKYVSGQKTDPWPAGKLNTEFAMHCTGKSKEEIEKLYQQYLNTSH